MAEERIQIGGGLTTLVFGAAVSPVLRVLLLFVGKIFMTAMTTALERFRMFQIRRRKDLQEIEKELTALAARSIAWDGDTIVRQIRSSELRAPWCLSLSVRRFLVAPRNDVPHHRGLFILTVMTIIAACR
jgi:hypothetical protein